LIGSLLGRAFGLYAAGEAAGWFLSVLGAVAVLAVYRRLMPQTTTGRV
jgi:uncharacterized membrane protein YeaQ/YmgE (transglycosylase-associated protein family)